jgi:hypothetical protein
MKTMRMGAGARWHLGLRSSLLATFALTGGCSQEEPLEPESGVHDTDGSADDGAGADVDDGAADHDCENVTGGLNDACQSSGEPDGDEDGSAAGTAASAVADGNSGSSEPDGVDTPPTRCDSPRSGSVAADECGDGRYCLVQSRQHCALPYPGVCTDLPDECPPARPGDEVHGRCPTQAIEAGLVPPNRRGCT